ncbi:MAG: DUF4139 domain-containing protein [Candidatus Hydrogenedentes bacterium]|nr:DUF4139 domain-containing protein [Candidatus Hydrogenedentota bacterium]
MRTLVIGIIISVLAPLAAGQEQPLPTSPTPAVKLEDKLRENVAASETSLADQTDIAVTAYNNNLALVRDRRKVKLLPGEQTLKFMDVAQQIRPETVSLRSVSAPGSLQILEQNYEYDLMSPAKLMEKFVGKEVRLVNFSKEIGFTEVFAELLSVHEGPIYRVNNEIFLGHPGNVVLPEIPENLIAKPSLIWLVDNDATDQEIEAGYLTGGIEWRADYVLTLAKSEESLDVAGWVTLNNQSGAQYTNAQLKLVAGEVNIVQEMLYAELAAEVMPKRAMAPPPMREEAFAEYHLYTLPRRTTIKQNQSKQVSLLTASGVNVQKQYEFRGDVSFYSQKFGPLKDQKVGVFLKFANKEANHMGMPLPAGIMRIYQEDSDGMLQFAGEDRIQHTPKDEEVRLKLGNAFDVVGERIQTDFRVIADNVFQCAYDVKVRNHKDKDITVDIVEPMPADWEILEKSHEYTKKDAHTAIFSVKVPKDGETVVKYRVQVRY